MRKLCRVRSLYYATLRSSRFMECFHGIITHSPAKEDNSIFKFSMLELGKCIMILLKYCNGLASAQDNKFETQQALSVAC